jgi:cell division protein FtsB
MKKTALKVNKKQIALAFLLVFLGYLMMDLNSRLSKLSQLSTQAAESQNEYASLKVTEAFLQTRIAYTTSEAAVEDYARDIAHLDKPGDMIVIPLADKDVTAVPEQNVEETQEPVENWQVWRALIIGQ